ncbi:MAG TPA: hypothetical protein VEK08_09785 [Planctomycetota bacterium]|nr:hypothetical protein [Planctomycetota bacterium]
MGRQLNFFMLPEDIAQFEQFVKTHPNVCFIEERQKTRFPQFVDSLTDKQLRLYLVKKENLNELTFIENAEQGYWEVDQSVYLPAIEFIPSRFDGHILQRGRLFYQTSYYTREGWKEYPTTLIKWGDSLLRWLRKNLVSDARIPDRLGNQAKKWISSIEPVIECFEIRHSKRN